MKIVVIGGSGLIGSKLCRSLVEQGHDAVPADLRTGVNTITRSATWCSIVGVDELGMGYGRAKLAQEELVVASGTPHCILRATQFFEFLAQIAESGADGDVVRLSAAKLQPIAADDVAATLAELATGHPRGGVEVAGPEIAGIDEWGRRLFAATGDVRDVITDATFHYLGTPISERTLVPRGEARRGRVTFDQWITVPEPVR